MFVLARTVAYATLFISLLLVFLPARILAWSGIARPPVIGVIEILGLLVCIVGAVLALWSVEAFVVIGHGTPAPFDPPRKLVDRGPYRYMRNPMYLGAAIALTGAALFYRSIPLLEYVALFLATTHVFVLWYEEPTLLRLFGADFQVYRSRVHRWLPRF